MDRQMQHKRVRDRLAHMKEANDRHRRLEILLAPKSEPTNHELEAKFADLLPLPPRLPRPLYAVIPNCLGKTEAELDFYVACEQGQLDEVTVFFRDHKPSQPVRQYGLEQASFANQPAVARYLLEHSTVLLVAPSTDMTMTWMTPVSLR